jgi:hypothetical protein
MHISANLVEVGPATHGGLALRAGQLPHLTDAYCSALAVLAAMHGYFAAMHGGPVAPRGTTAAFNRRLLFRPRSSRRDAWIFRRDAWRRVCQKSSFA